jgi:hypothetical protein
MWCPFHLVNSKSSPNNMVFKRFSTNHCYQYLEAVHCSSSLVELHKSGEELVIFQNGTALSEICSRPYRMFLIFTPKYIFYKNYTADLREILSFTALDRNTLSLIERKQRNKNYQAAVLLLTYRCKRQNKI